MLSEHAYCRNFGVTSSSHVNTIARCTVLDFSGNVLLDQYIKPEEQITDYRTPYSGISEIHMKEAIPYKDARETIWNLIKGKVVVGHALDNDFQALGFSVPLHMRRDTLWSPDLRRMMDNAGINKMSLKSMAKHILNRHIQNGPHCSFEDALATLDLFKCVLLTRGVWKQAARDSGKFTHLFDDHYWVA
ncbi:apoptosis-enhancing nuclease-like [Octopus sinensis]|uniref:Apoptosis-enhancing nuclease-like n=1 Tax=Octopus sinensis TaxID=2607531 RepID=A0A6P7TQQ2_9MOLL|nr:apoptosis-enhancing nuclease-like [Octopus sinensis]